MREGVGLALELGHPEPGRLGAVALGVAEVPRADVGDDDVGRASVAWQRPEDGVICRLPLEELLGGLGVSGALDPNGPIARTGVEGHLARPGVQRRFARP